MNSSIVLNRLFEGFQGDRIQFVPCSDWVGPHHIFLQMANFFLLLGFFFCSTSIGSSIFFRSSVLIANLMTLLWIWLVSCSSDLLFWNSSFAILNSIHLIFLLFRLHTFIKFPHEVEMAYRNLFLPLGVSRYNFKKLYSYTRGIQTMKSKDFYAIENQTTIDKLSLLLSGRISVMRNNQTCHMIDCYQFLESPEWFGMNTSETYQVSFIALEESQLLVWNRDKLKLSISSDRYLQAILDHILGKDIVKKLMLTMDIDTPANIVVSPMSNVLATEKSQLMQMNNFSLEHHQPILSINTLKNSSQCFWNLSTRSNHNDTNDHNHSFNHNSLKNSPHETTL